MTYRRLYGHEHVHVAKVEVPGVRASVRILGVKHPRWTHTVGTQKYKFTAIRLCDTRITKKYSAESSTRVRRMVGQVDLGPHIE